MGRSNIRSLHYYPLHVQPPSRRSSASAKGYKRLGPRLSSFISITNFATLSRKLYSGSKSKKNWSRFWRQSLWCSLSAATFPTTEPADAFTQCDHEVSAESLTITAKQQRATVAWTDWRMSSAYSARAMRRHASFSWLRAAMQYRTHSRHVDYCNAIVPWSLDDYWCRSHRGKVEVTCQLL